MEGRNGSEVGVMLAEEEGRGRERGKTLGIDFWGNFLHRGRFGNIITRSIYLCGYKFFMLHDYISLH